MNRREFISKTSAGLSAALIAPGLWSCSLQPSEKRQFRFRPYRPNTTAEKTVIVSPEDGFYMHTYYDICPWSASGRFLAVTKLPFQDHDPTFGETAEVCIIDLHEETIQSIYTTKAWGFQLGANLNWGKSDRFIYTNDIIDGEGVCVRIDLQTFEAKAYVGFKTHIAPDESHFLGFPSHLINASQTGYAMPDIPGVETKLPSVGEVLADEGIWKTDLATNTKSLIASVDDFYQLVPNKEDFGDRIFSLFFSKYNRLGTRSMEFLRGILPAPKKGQRKFIQMGFNHDPNGGDIKLAVTYGVHAPTQDTSNWRPDWKPGGHHITWTPDGEYLTMNLTPDGENMRFCSFKYDGTEFKVLSETLKGGGHPTMEKTGRFLIADAYPVESNVLPNKEVPIRLIDLEADQEIVICYVYTLGIIGSLRCDPHPCWNRDYTQVCFNGAPDGRRQVFITDLAKTFS